MASSEISNTGDSLSEKENAITFKNNISAALDDLEQTFQSGLKSTPGFHITHLASCAGNRDVTNGPNQLYLIVELTGYGSIKQEWKNVLIETGIAEGILQGIAVGAATQNPWLGAAVAGEEITSEYLTWNGVDWILGETYAPVTLEGSLYYIMGHTLIWRDNVFITSNEESLNDTEKTDKSLQLKASLHKAEAQLLSGLNDYLNNEITHKETMP